MVMMVVAQVNMQAASRVGVLAESRFGRLPGRSELLPEAMGMIATSKGTGTWPLRLDHVWGVSEIVAAASCCAY